MVDTADLKSAAVKSVPVRVRSRVPLNVLFWKKAVFTSLMSFDAI
jgi:hypothetical protein